MKSLVLLVLAAFLNAVSVSAAEPAPKLAVPAANEGKPFKNVGVEEFDKLRADKQKVVLDVRTPKEFAEGHIPGAINIDWNAPDFEKKVLALDKSKTYLVHCAGGVRSTKACDMMGKIKFASLFNLEPGLRAWEKAGKAIEKGAAR
jgi:rhodanese-related sulfurtransferase